ARRMDPGLRRHDEASGESPLLNVVRPDPSSGRVPANSFQQTFLRRDVDVAPGGCSRFRARVSGRGKTGFDTASCAGMTIVVSVAPDARQARATKDHRAVLTRPLSPG